jgi:hypothetical protein
LQVAVANPAAIAAIITAAGNVLTVDGAGNGAIGGVHGGCVGARAVHDEDALGDRVIGERIGVLAGLEGADFLESFQVDDEGLARGAIHRESAAQFGYGKQAGGTFHPGDLADDRAGIDVDHVNVISAPDVQTPGLVVHGDVVPAFGAADRNRFYDVIAGCAGRGWNGSRAAEKQCKAQRNSCDHRKIFATHTDETLPWRVYVPKLNNTLRYSTGARQAKYGKG